VGCTALQTIQVFDFLVKYSVILNKYILFC